MTTVLAFGHVPKHFGGQQQSGLANAMWAMATHMADPESGVRVVFCATDIRERNVRIDGVPVIGWTKISLVMAILRSPITWLWRMLRLVRICRKYEAPLFRTWLRAVHLGESIALSAPDFVHLHGCESVFFLETGMVEPAKTVVTLHGLHGKGSPPKLRRLEEELSGLRPRLIVFVSRQNQAEWQVDFGRETNRTAVIPNSFDRTQFFVSDAGQKKGGVKSKFQLVSVGSITENKGQERVVEAIVRLRSEGIQHHVEYVMIGGGDRMIVDRLFHCAESAGVHVRHFPYLSPAEIRRVLAMSDFMILPSRREGFGLVFLESIACGVPVVLPRTLPICDEPGLVTDANAVFLESSEVDKICDFLKKLPSYSFIAGAVAATLTSRSWKHVGASYREVFGHISSSGEAF